MRLRRDLEAEPDMASFLIETHQRGIIFHLLCFYISFGFSISGSFSKEVNIPEVDRVFLPDSSFSVNSFPSKQKAQMFKPQPLPPCTEHGHQNQKELGSVSASVT